MSPDSATQRWAKIYISIFLSGHLASLPGMRLFHIGPLSNHFHYNLSLDRAHPVRDIVQSQCLPKVQITHNYQLGKSPVLNSQVWTSLRQLKRASGGSDRRQGGINCLKIAAFPRYLLPHAPPPPPLMLNRPWRTVSTSTHGHGKDGGKGGTVKSIFVPFLFEIYLIWKRSLW